MAAGEEWALQQDEMRREPRCGGHKNVSAAPVNFEMSFRLFSESAPAALGQSAQPGSAGGRIPDDREHVEPGLARHCRKISLFATWFARLVQRDFVLLLHFGKLPHISSTLQPTTSQKHETRLLQTCSTPQTTTLPSGTLHWSSPGQKSAHIRSQLPHFSVSTRSLASKPYSSSASASSTEILPVASAMIFSCGQTRQSGTCCLGTRPRAGCASLRALGVAGEGSRLRRATWTPRCSAAGPSRGSTVHAEANRPRACHDVTCGTRF